MKIDLVLPDLTRLNNVSMISNDMKAHTATFLIDKGKIKWLMKCQQAGMVFVPIETKPIFKGEEVFPPTGLSFNIRSLMCLGDFIPEIEYNYLEENIRNEYYEFDYKENLFQVDYTVIKAASQCPENTLVYVHEVVIL